MSLSDVSAGICPDGRAAMVLQGAWSFAASHARAVEPVTLSHYQSGDSWWLGMRGRLGLGTTQPFAGPAPPGSWQPTLEAELLQASFSPGDSMTTLTLPLEPVP